MEFLSLYSLQMNRVMSAMLRLTEIKDVLRQMSHLPRKDLINFADLPRFLTMELNVRLVAIPTLVYTLDALKSGFAAIIQPLVDYEYQESHGRGSVISCISVVEPVPHCVPRGSPVGPPTNLPHASKASWPRHKGSKSRPVHGARPFALGSVPSANGLHADVSRPNRKDLDERAPKLVFCRDFPPATLAGNS